MKINAILAHDYNYGIGKNNKLPWPKNKADLSWFQNHTKNQVVLMGRKTWESLGYNSLPDRINCVITQKEHLQGDWTYKFDDLKKSILFLKKTFPEKELWIIGGAQIYMQTLPICDELYITKFHDRYECDTYLELTQYLENFYEYSRKEQDDLSFSIWKNKNHSFKKD